ncbi:MAG: 2'-deoxycytidine 5'-triphosphate deaminase [archaeon]|nr:MAG: 2'-deoxycytidine 5'-triphosphate deaminase [archaeon]
MGEPKDFCFGSREIREMINSKRLIFPEGVTKDPNKKEQLIQPSSFEAPLGDHCYVLDMGELGLFRPRHSQTVKKTLLKLEHRRKKDITNGFELKIGYGYLFPLNASVKLIGREFIKSSPRSRSGRNFLDIRFLADYNSSFDEIHSSEHSEYVSLWLLVKPQIYNIIVRPGITLNQLRVFSGPNAELTPEEVKEICEKENILYRLNGEGKLIPIKPEITHDGITLHLDLVGPKNHEGVVALKAKSNPDPIDFSLKEEYDAEDYFVTMIIEDKEIKVDPTSFRLMASKEYIRTPLYLSMELRDYSHLGMRGALHYAGFIDSGFEGQIVLETKSEESSDIVLRHGMPISHLRLFRTGKGVPDKVYGPEIGSHFKGQVGVRPSSHFKPMDFESAAKIFHNLEINILAYDKDDLDKIHPREFSGKLRILDQGKEREILTDISNGFFMKRRLCEKDYLLVQPVPSLIIFDNNGNIWRYRRKGKKAEYAESELVGTQAIAFNGHIREQDTPEYLKTGLIRQIWNRELEWVGEGDTSPSGIVRNKQISERLFNMKFVGTLYAGEGKPVDQRHVGIVFAVNAEDVELKPRITTNLVGKPPITIQRASVHDLQKVPISDVIKELSLFRESYDTWSQILIPHLEEIYSKLIRYN